MLCWLGIGDLARGLKETAPGVKLTDSELAYRIDLNEADLAEILQVPGVGPALAERILQYRKDHAGFRDVKELLEIPRIGPSTLARFGPWVCVNGDTLDTDDWQALAKEKKARVLTKPPAPTIAVVSAKTKALAATGPININRAPLAELQRLPGIGLRTAQRIIEERSKVPFQSAQDLRRIPGIGPKKLEQLRPYITVGPQTPATSHANP
jgi:competence protein ComEA